MGVFLPQQGSADTDVQRSSYNRSGDEIKITNQTSGGRGYVSSTVTYNINGSATGVTDLMKYDISTKMPAVYGSNKALYFQSGRGYPIFMSAGSEFEVTADNITKVSGSPEEFGNDYNTARYEAMMDYNCTLLNKEDGTDTEAAQTSDYVTNKIKNFITNPLGGLSAANDYNSQDSSGADDLAIPEYNGNHKAYLMAWAEYALNYNTQIKTDTVLEKARVQLETTNKMKAESIRQNLLLIIDFNENRLKSIDKISENIIIDSQYDENELHERAAKLKDIVLKKSTNELLLIVASSATDVIIIDGYQLTPIPGKTGINMFFGTDLSKNIKTDDRLSMQAEIQNYQLKTLVDSIHG